MRSVLKAVFSYFACLSTCFGMALAYGKLFPWKQFCYFFSWFTLLSSLLFSTRCLPFNTWLKTNLDQQFKTHPAMISLVLRPPLGSLLRVAPHASSNTFLPSKARRIRLLSGPLMSCHECAVIIMYGRMSRLNELFGSRGKTCWISFDSEI